MSIVRVRVKIKIRIMMNIRIRIRIAKRNSMGGPPPPMGIVRVWVGLRLGL